MATFVPLQAYAAGNPSSHTSQEKPGFIPSLDRGPPYIEEDGVVYQHESYPWVVGRAFEEVPPMDLQPVRLSASVVDGNKQPWFYIVLRGHKVGILLDSAAATMFTNGITDGFRFKSRSQVHAVQEFNRYNALGEVKICHVRQPHAQVVITANWRFIVGLLALFLVGYFYLLARA